MDQRNLILAIVLSLAIMLSFEFFYAGPQREQALLQVEQQAEQVERPSAHALGTTGREFTESSIGDALASRDLSAHLREIGVATGGPRPLLQKDRSRFLSKLDELVQRAQREQ